MLRHFLRPRWLAFHLVVGAAIVLMVNLALWQLDRLDERRAFNDRVSARIDREPVAVEDALPAVGGADPDVWEWVPVVASGTYLTDEQVVVVNRSQDGVAGQNVVTPLRLDDGRLLLVNRGFVPLTADVPGAPGGSVAVRGLLRMSQERGFGGARDPSEGRITELQRLDVDRLAQQLDGEVLPLWLSLQVSDPDQGSSLAPLPRPALSSGPHLSYAVQWAIFAACVAIGWVFAVRRSATTYRAASASSLER